jgi:hypothetical protein
MGGICNTHGEMRNHTYIYILQKVKGKYTLEDPDADLRK